MALGIPKPGNYYFLVPIISFLPWYIMLTTMLTVWIHQGRPQYEFMKHHHSLVFISDIGATNLHPLFIICSFWEGAGYCYTVACEYYQRSGHWPFQRKNLSNNLNDNNIVDRDHPVTHPNAPSLINNRLSTSSDLESDTTYLEGFERDNEQVPTSDSAIEDVQKNYTKALLSSKFLMPPWYTRDERNLIWAAWVLGLIGEVCLCLCSIFSTVKFHRAHITMVYFFLFFMYFSIVCLVAEYFVMGRHYAMIHPLANLPPHIHVNSIPWYRWEGYIWNKFTISATLKAIWLVVAILCSICFGIIPNDSIKAAFEWTLGFWLGLFFIIISFDFYLGGRYKTSRYFHQIESFSGYYKYDNAMGINNTHKKGRSNHLKPITSNSQMIDDLSSLEVESAMDIPIAIELMNHNNSSIIKEYPVIQSRDEDDEDHDDAEEKVLHPASLPHFQFDPPRD